jgi:hypothetical protein
VITPIITESERGLSQKRKITEEEEVMNDRTKLSQ